MYSTYYKTKILETMKDKGALMFLLVCLIGVLTFTGIYYFNREEIEKEKIEIRERVKARKFLTRDN